LKKSKDTSGLKICVLGSRGFPGIQGGVEVHCEMLYPRIAALGVDVTVLTRKPYVDPNLKTYKNVNLVPVYCPRNKSLEAMIYSFFGTFAAKKIKPDIVHFHAIGPSLMIPLARLLGLKTVMTNHGPDYDRQKWGKVAKTILKLGERFGSRWANKIICISETIVNNVKDKYKRESVLIFNGVEIPELAQSTETLDKFGLTKGKYILTVGRFVPEKGFSDLIDAFNTSELEGWKLAIVGSADHENPYSREIEAKASQSHHTVLTGIQIGESLHQIYSHAGLFVLPSYHEGLPIVLLEAMSYGLQCIASNIPANVHVELPEENYFRAGDIEHLSEKLLYFTKRALSKEQKDRQLEGLKQKYNWDGIALKTFDLYKGII